MKLVNLKKSPEKFNGGNGVAAMFRAPGVETSATAHNLNSSNVAWADVGVRPISF